MISKMQQLEIGDIIISLGSNALPLFEIVIMAKVGVTPSPVWERTVALG
jgi:hypothetical protein